MRTPCDLSLVHRPLGWIGVLPGHHFPKARAGGQARASMEDFRVNAMGFLADRSGQPETAQGSGGLTRGRAPSVVGFSTVAVQTGMGFHASIAAAKGAVEGLVRTMAAEFAPDIRVNAIAPSLTDTPLAAVHAVLRRQAGGECRTAPLKRIASRKTWPACGFLAFASCGGHHGPGLAGRQWDERRPMSHTDGGLGRCWA